MIFENGALKTILIDGGYIRDGVYYFYVTGHLGNNYMVVNQDGEVVQKNQYYPGGMSFADDVNQSEQPYKYNGKELEPMHGLNLYDYLGRFYDPTIWRLPTLDPLAEMYYSISPYVYCANNPMRFIDPDGRKLQIANEPKIAAESIARIVATNRGRSLFNTLIGSNNLYTLKQTYFGSFSVFNDHNPKNNIILYGSTSRDGVDYTEWISMIHESMHAFNHAKGNFTDSRKLTYERRKRLEHLAVSMENYLREVYSITPLRDTYKGYGQKNDHGIFQHPAGEEKVSNFQFLGNNKNETAFGFSYETNDNTRYILINYDKDKNVIFNIYKTEDEYKKATEGW